MTHPSFTKRARALREQVDNTRTFDESTASCTLATVILSAGLTASLAEFVEALLMEVEHLQNEVTTLKAKVNA